MSTAPIIFEAIVKRHAVAATYNRGDVILAPHVAYTRHGEIYVDAFTLARDGRPPREEKLGSFKLDGLGGLRLTPRRFEPNPLFDATAQRYTDTTLLMIDMAPAAA